MQIKIYFFICANFPSIFNIADLDEHMGLEKR